jgi:hypothetical protein
VIGVTSLTSRDSSAATSFGAPRRSRGLAARRGALEYRADPSPCCSGDSASAHELTHVPRLEAFRPSSSSTAARSRIESWMIIPLIIPTIRLPPSGPNQIESAPSVSRQFPSGSVQSDDERLPRNRKVVGSTPTSGSTSPQVRAL